MRFVSLLAGLVLTLAAVFPALAYDTPQALIEAVYAPYLAQQMAEDEASWRSEHLNALYQADADRTPEGEMGALGFDPYINGQDWTITDLAIGEPALDGDSGTVTVTFKNFGVDQELVYTVVQEADGWKVDDVEAVTGEVQYKLSDILAGE